MMVLVRQLQPTEQGLPMELYFFTDTVDWVPYEAFRPTYSITCWPSSPNSTCAFPKPSGNDLRTLIGKTDTNH